MEKLASEHPEHFTELINRWTFPILILLWGVAILLLWQLYRIFRKSGRWIESKIPKPEQKKTVQPDKPESESVPKKNNSVEEQTL